MRAAAEPIDGPLAAAISEIARRHAIALVAGLPEADGDIVYNAAFMVAEDGVRLATCRKSHLFGTVDRAQFAAAGDFAPVFTYRGWRLALAICHDVEFPELVRTLALDGAEALLVPTANMEPYTGGAQRIVPARAEENEIFVAYANYVGTEGTFHYCGLSCIVGPDGSDLARAGAHEEAIFADLDRKHLQAVRGKLSHLNDRRPRLVRSACSEETRNDRPGYHVRSRFPFGFDDWRAHPDGLGAIPAEKHGARVAIIGAGIAGVICGYELMRLGLRPILFESGQFGGRLRSQPFEGADGVIAELGGMRFPVSSTGFYSYVDRLGLESQPFPNPLTKAAGSAVIDIGGETHYARTLADLPTLYSEIAEAYDKALDDGANFLALKQAIRDRDPARIKEIWHPIVRTRDERTFYDFVASSAHFQKLSFRHREVFGQVGFGTGGWDSDFPNSMLEILRVDGAGRKSAVHRWRGRTGPLGPLVSRTGADRALAERNHACCAERRWHEAGRAASVPRQRGQAERHRLGPDRSI